MRCAICVPAAQSLTLNCGYGHGFSVLEVIETVKRVSGVDFKVEIAPRRAGDPAQIVADSDRARATLGWQPRFDDLSDIVAHALAWERRADATPRGDAIRPRCSIRETAGRVTGRFAHAADCQNALENRTPSGH